MRQNAPHLKLELLPPSREKVETIKILKQTNKSTAALARANAFKDLKFWL